MLLKDFCLLIVYFQPIVHPLYHTRSLDSILENIDGLTR